MNSPVRPTTPRHPFLKVTFLIGGMVVLLWVISFFPALALAFILSSLAAFILNPFVRLFESKAGMRRVPAIIMTFLTVGGSIVYIFSIIIPALFDRFLAIHEKIKTFPFESKLLELTTGLEKTLPFVSGASVAESVHSLIARSSDIATDAIQQAFGTLVTLAIVPFITYFILADGRKTYIALIERVPNRYFEMTLNVAQKIGRQLVGYLKGWILDSMIVGILTIIGLSIIGIDYPFVIGILAGIANLVPYLGPVVGASLAIVVSLTQTGDFSMVGSILAMTIVIRMIDDFVVQPTCFSKSIDMHPLAVILLLLVGHEMMGIGGMLLAIPLATILKVSSVESYWGLKNYRITF